MSTIVFFHAHPDDESSQTAGMMHRAAALGHRVLLLIATDGRHGTPPAKGGDIVAHRRGEVEASTRALGIEPPLWLGYHDSGMLGDEKNSDPSAFASADLSNAAQQVAEILAAESADAVVIYDHHGGYGHPDHVKVHEVGMAAVELVSRTDGQPVEVFIMSNDNSAFASAFADPQLVAVLEREAPEMAKAFAEIDPEELGKGSDGELMGLPASDLVWRITLSEEELAAKRSAMQCHASQTSDVGFMLALPHEIYARQFGVEHLTTPEYIGARGTVGPPSEGWPFGAKEG
ncbi:PIG-L family deacetylase [Dietzia sp.]|uniref:PIG-L family deacetylase n=1 Tax=Dietzia sp. TaxID=1871616 RepID=UPI002FD8EC37